jgi:hemerythrin superfamily protein
MAHTRIRAIAATAMLRDDHRKVKELFSQYESIADRPATDSKLELFLEMKKELTIHSEIEEEIFYPAIESLRGQDEQAGELIQDAREDHRTVKTLLEELTDLEPEDEEFDSKIGTLMEVVSQHADQEEEQMFPFFGDLPKEQQVQVSDDLRIRKAELEAEYDEE